MKLIGLATLGRDPEIKTSQNGDPFIPVSIWYPYGKKGTDGKRPTQFVDVLIYGKKAEFLAPYLAKGQKAYLEIIDLHIEQYQKKDGTTGASLKGFVQEYQIAGDRKDAAPAQPKAEKVEELVDDIPF